VSLNSSSWSPHCFVLRQTKPCPPTWTFHLIFYSIR
jgi:hypothetical protein